MITYTLAASAAETATHTDKGLPAWVAVPVFLGLMIALWFQWANKKEK
jgi:hypothetical protein